MRIPIVDVMPRGKETQKWGSESVSRLEIKDMRTREIEVSRRWTDNRQDHTGGWSVRGIASHVVHGLALRTGGV